MASLSQARLLGYLPSPHRAFQEHAAHPIEWSMALSSKGSSGTCIPEVLRHSSILLSRRSASYRYTTGAWLAELFTTSTSGIDLSIMEMALCATLLLLVLLGRTVVTSLSYW